MTIVCEPSVERAETLASQVVGPVVPVSGIDTLGDALSANPGETVVVLGAGVELAQALELTTSLRRQHPGVGVVLVRFALTVEDLTAAMRAGVREVLQADDAPAIAEACERYQRVLTAGSVEVPPADRNGGEVTTVFSAKGGCGKTTFATNLAVTLATAGQRVCLVDLDFAFGDVAITLGLTPTRTVLDVLSLGKTLSEDKVASLVTPYTNGVDCLLAPVAPGEAERIPVAATSTVIDLLRGMYDHVVIDTPAQINEQVLTALDAAHNHVLLTTPELPALKNLRLVLDMLDLLAYERNSRTIVLNRSDADVGLSDADIERVVKSPIAGRVPSSRDVPVSINKGVPLSVQNGQHPVSIAVRGFVATHLHQPVQQEARRRGLRLRRRSS
jgi:Flp pilus assembly CpaE family ATPase